MSFGLQLYQPDVVFDSSFNSLVVVAEYTYTAGGYHPINMASTDMLFARPTGSPANARLVISDFDESTGVPLGFRFSTPVVSMGAPTHHPFKVVVCRPSVTLNRNLNTGFGLAVFDENGKPIFNTNEKYVSYYASGKGYGYTAPQPIITDTGNVYVSVDAWMRTHFFMQGAGEEGSFRLSYSPNYQSGNIQMMSGQDFTATHAYVVLGPYNAYGHWLAVTIV